MEVIPSIDLRAGQVVRLTQGDYDRMTVYDADPVGVARRWETAGARTLHVVDLDGAATGEQANLAVIGRIAEEVAMDVQVGGGVRSIEAGTRLFDAGVARVVIGTAAVKEPALVDAALAAWGAEAVAVGIDARGGKATTDGWRATSERSAIEFAQEMCSRGVTRIVYTDIAVDGMLLGPNYSAMAEMVAAIPAAVVASGGVATLGHLRLLAETGAAAAIVGRSLYAGTLDLAEAIRTC